MITFPDEATCPNCHGQPQPKKVCWGCRNRGRVETWRVCPTCGKWIDGCMCPRESRVADVTKRRPGRPRPRPAPAYPSFTTPAEGNESPSAERIGGGDGFQGQPEPSAADSSCGSSATVDAVATVGAAVPVATAPCWLGLIAEACRMEQFGPGFYVCRRCGYVRQQR